MTIPLLPTWNLQPNRPSFYDTDSATMLELAAKMQAAFNEMVEDYNKFSESVNTQIVEFMNSTNADQEAFQVGIRQEFQDFINVVDFKITNMVQDIENIKKDVAKEVNTAIKNGDIYVASEYDPETESLNLVVSGGVNNG